MINDFPKGNSPYFVTFDGSKGVGKSSILNETYKLLSNHFEVIKLCEKELDPYRINTLKLLNKFKETPDKDLELSICKNLALGREYITKNYIFTGGKSNIVLIDRWYPSDAAFRKIIPFREILNLNKGLGVKEADLVIAVTCEIKESWRRANTRERGLDSHVIDSFENHIQSNNSFIAEAEINRWHICNNDGELSKTVESVMNIILKNILN